MTQVQPSAVVTGASTGIGAACAKRLVDEGWRVFAGVRKPADGERLKADLGASLIPVIIDVTDTASVKAAAKTVGAALDGQTLKGLVNNAGIAVAGPMLELPLEEFENQMDVNVTGIVRVTQAFGPLLGVDASLTGEPGRIVMMSSVAGEMGAPFLGPWAFFPGPWALFLGPLRSAFLGPWPSFLGPWTLLTRGFIWAVR